MSVRSRFEARQRANRRITDAFIAQAPVDLVLTPVLRVETPSGGWKESDLPERKAQTFTIVRNNTQFSSEIERTEVGEARVAEYMLLGRWNAEIAVGDWWIDAATGRQWTVTDDLFNNGYEIRAVVTERGR